jgi:hypothetical protein
MERRRIAGGGRIVSPGEPTYLRAAEPTAVLTWRDTSKDGDGFGIYRIVGRERTKLAEVKANVTRYVDKDPVPKACYIVTAFNAAGESPATNVVCLPGILEPGKTYRGRAD